jgi:hypothetical protein
VVGPNASVGPARMFRQLGGPVPLLLGATRKEQTPARSVMSLTSSLGGVAFLKMLHPGLLHLGWGCLGVSQSPSMLCLLGFSLGAKES